MVILTIKSDYKFALLHIFVYYQVLVSIKFKSRNNLKFTNHHSRNCIFSMLNIWFWPQIFLENGQWCPIENCIHQPELLGGFWGVKDVFWSGPNDPKYNLDNYSNYTIQILPKDKIIIYWAVWSILFEATKAFDFFKMVHTKSMFYVFNSPNYKKFME